MSDERVFHVSAGLAVPAQPVALAQAGFRERDDLQEWVIAHPEILGDDVLILTSEFDRWESSSGARQLNRLDVLGIDAEGRLVLAELKRDRAADAVQLQAINYAALVSKLEPKDVVEIYREHLARRGEPVSFEMAAHRIDEHCGELIPELLSTPKIVLVAGEFSVITTTAVDWLTEQGLDITLQKVQAYQISSGETVLTVSQLYPLAVVDDLLASPRRTAFTAKQNQARGSREKNTVHKLTQSQVIADGTPLHLAPTNEVPAAVRDQIQQWLHEKPERRLITWQNSRSAPLVWGIDGEGYKPTTLVKQVILEATGTPRASVNGPRWFVDDSGQTLPEIAGNQSASGFDWEPMHAVLQNIPAGRWTSYGDLAALVGTAATPLGAHLGACSACEFAWRVLDGEGRSSPNFYWKDPERPDSQQEVLEREGVVFEQDGRARAELRLTAEELRELFEQEEDDD